LSHALPKYISKEADQDVRLDPVFSLVPERPQAQVLFVDAEGGPSVGQLNIGSPEIFACPVLSARAEEITPFA
jgi:hypothetical protein